MLFLLQLCTVVVIALVNGLSLGQPPSAPQGHHTALPAPPPPAAPGVNPAAGDSALSDDVVRSHQLLLMLVVAALLSALLTALWLAMLRVCQRGLEP